MGVSVDMGCVGTGDVNTFSAYVKTGAGEVYLAWFDGSDAATSEVLPPNSDWTRLQVTYKNNTSSSKSVSPRLLSLQAGTSYMDCVQIEKSPTASRYNLIENGDYGNRSCV